MRKGGGQTSKWTRPLHFIIIITRGLVHKFVHRWSPSAWPVGIGLKPAIQRHLLLLPATPAHPGPSAPAPACTQSVLIQRGSPAMSPASGAHPRGVRGTRMQLVLWAGGEMPLPARDLDPSCWLHTGCREPPGSCFYIISSLWSV